MSILRSLRKILGVRVWHVLEVVLWEIAGTAARRMFDPTTGFELLEP